MQLYLKRVYAKFLLISGLAKVSATKIAHTSNAFGINEITRATEPRKNNRLLPNTWAYGF